ncbi:MFS transporter [Lutimonas zeaxanthinifaciens]|uniref:MFS transporter n=1 Tax=Lutimonas zeaxanthinifaciens TaxID=3060215 RepID=UPI00265CE20B|nr:MFS transporter [Lutimonas sp. YSD2104]WKK65119.1 MFS transporter [Lutimonas sp. YSD2104]
MSAITNKVPFGQKLAFGVGMFANQMFPAILGIFMVSLVQSFGFSGWMWSLVYFFPRIFDAITDPIMGFISDNTKSKYGRRKPYVFIGAVLMGVAFTVMWQIYSDNALQYNFWYFFLWSVVFYLGLTFFSVPYVAMGYEMSNDFHERTNIMAVAQWIGQWAWVIAPWFWVIMDDPDWFTSQEVAIRELAAWVAVPCAIAAMIPAIFIKSKSTLDENYEPLNTSNIGGSLLKILQSFVDAFKIAEFRKICGATFLIFNAFNTVAALTYFVIVYKLFNGDAAATGIWVALFGCIGALGTTFIVIPAVTRMSKKMGKIRAFMWSQGISLIGYTMMYFLFVPGKPWLYLFALPFFSFGIGSLFTIMMSMTADVIDIDELNSGKRREGIFGAIYWWMVKVGFAIAGALSGIIIGVVGFNPDLATTDQQGAVDGLHAFFCFFPAVGTIFAMLIMKSYDVTEDRANEIREELDRRKSDINPDLDAKYQGGKLISLVSKDLKGSAGTDIDFSGKSSSEIKKLYLGSLKKGLHGLCFSPYAEGQDIGDILSENQIRHRMEVIAPYTKWVRSFSCTEGNEFIPVAAREKGLKTMAGAWIEDNKKENDLEIQALIEQARNGNVDMAVVGNEVLLRGELRTEDIIDYIKLVKEALPDIPVGYVDAYYQFVQNQDLVDACDVILVNCYPFWEGCHIDQSTQYLQEMYKAVKKVSKGKPVIISETGWPSEGSTTGDAVASQDNAIKYFINVQSWANKEGIELYYFSSFDESWKVHHEGDVGQRWGIWDKNEKLKNI